MEDKNKAQLVMFGTVDQAIAKVFGATALKDKEGNSVGTSIAMMPRKEIGKALGLTRKDQKEELDAAILEQRDAAFLRIKGDIASLGKEWTLQKAAMRTMKSGERQITLVTREVKRNSGPSVQQIAKAYGITDEQALEKLIKAQLEKEAALAADKLAEEQLAAEEAKLAEPANVESAE